MIRMQPLYQQTASEVKKQILAKKVSVREWVKSCLSRIDATDRSLKAWVYRNDAYAMRQADEVQRLIDGGDILHAGCLAGAPVGIKDIFNTEELPTAMGSPIWKDFTPGNDARVVHYIRQNGGVVAGKTTTAEFAVHAPAETVNPHRPEYSPGTSSSGSAASVAAFQVPLAIGTQTAGSIIRPASYCGVFGFKPSFGLVPRTGALKTTDTLDTVGLFARSVEDIKLLFDVMRVHGANFPYIHQILENPECQQKAPLEPWRVLLVTDQTWVWNESEAYAKTALTECMKKLNSAEVRIEVGTLPASLNEVHRIHGVIYDKTLAYYFKNEFKQHTLISKILYEIISRGNQITIEQYRDALNQQIRIKSEFEKLFSKYDAVIALSTGGEAPRWGGDDRPDTSLIWTFCHAPSLNIPVFKGPNGLPFGFQLVGSRYRDYRLLELAAVIEKKLSDSLYFKTASLPALQQTQSI